MHMAYDSTQFVEQPTLSGYAHAALQEEFRRGERIAVLAGAMGVGAVAGFSAAMSFGRLDLWITIAVALPLFAILLHFSAITFSEALARNAYGCATASVLHVGALLAWPMTSLFTPIGQVYFFIAPALAVATLILFASCWGGPARAVYRMSAQGALVAALAAHQGAMVVLG
jgi:hypothetical protein